MRSFCRHGETKNADTWLSTVKNYASPKFGNRPLHTIGTADILSLLSPIWTEKHETAKRLKQRLSSIFDWAKGAGHYPHENPVDGITKALPTLKRRAEHMAALDWRDVPAFKEDLAERVGVSAASNDEICLRFMAIPGVGPIAALTFKAAVDDPKRFTSSRTVAAHFGLTPRCYQTGEMGNPGRISKAGDADVRSALLQQRTR